MFSYIIYSKSFEKRANTILHVLLLTDTALCYTVLLYTYWTVLLCFILFLFPRAVHLHQPK